MSDEAGRFTAEHTIMDKDVEIREQKHLLEQRDKIISDLTKKVKELEQKIEKLKGPNPYDDVDYSVAEEAETEWHIGEENKSEDSFTEQLSFTFNQE